MSARARTYRWAGPALIATSVLVALHGFWLHPKLTTQQTDLLAFWLPRWGFLGANLAHGHLPLWLPNQFGGVPFLSDPQSGWTYLPVMLLFSVTSAARAFGLFVTLQPIVAGLGLYGFLRHERLGRPAATVGGLCLAMMMAGSSVSLSLPFSGTLAWTAVALAGGAGSLHAERGRARLGWFALAELGLTQVAAAHLTDGLLFGGGLLLVYLVARSLTQVRAGGRAAGRAVLLVGAVFAAFPLLAAATLLPRLALLPRTPLGSGYRAVGTLADHLSGTTGPSALAAHAVGPWWGTGIARGPGGYLGALGIVLLPFAVTDRRFRWPAVGFALVGLSGWVLNLDALVASPAVRRFALDHFVGELWLRDPDRFRYLLLPVGAALAAYGLQAWLDRPAGDGGLARRLAWLLPSVVVFVALPLLAGTPPAQYLPLLAGLAWAVPALAAAARGASWPRAAIPLALAAELVAVALAGQLGPVPHLPPDQLRTEADPGLGRAFAPLHAPWIDPAGYLTPGPIGRAIQDGPSTLRYLSFDPVISAASVRGFLFHQEPADWAAYENGRSILFGIEEVQGYSPVQLDRYWRLVRRADRAAPIFYNSATFQTVDPAVLRLFGVGWIIQPAGLPAPPGASRASSEDGRDLYRLADPDPRASVVFDLRPVPPGGGLDEVLRPGFRPAEEAVVEGLAGAAGADTGTGTAVYRELVPEHMRVTADASGPGLLVVRNAWDPNWHATVDGRPARLVPADYLLQGVPVPAGRHVVDLVYRDPAVGRGLAVSAAAWLVLLAMAAAGRVTPWRRTRS